MSFFKKNLLVVAGPGAESARSLRRLPLSSGLKGCSFASWGGYRQGCRYPISRKGLKLSAACTQIYAGSSALAVVPARMPSRSRRGNAAAIDWLNDRAMRSWDVHQWAARATMGLEVKRWYVARRYEPCNLRSTVSEL